MPGGDAVPGDAVPVLTVGDAIGSDRRWQGAVPVLTVGNGRDAARRQAGSGVRYFESDGRLFEQAEPLE